MEDYRSANVRKTSPLVQLAFIFVLGMFLLAIIVLVGVGSFGMLKNQMGDPFKWEYGPVGTLPLYLAVITAVVSSVMFFVAGIVFFSAETSRKVIPTKAFMRALIFLIGLLFSTVWFLNFFVTNAIVRQSDESLRNPLENLWPLLVSLLPMAILSVFFIRFLLYKSFYAKKRRMKVVGALVAAAFVLQLGFYTFETLRHQQEHENICIKLRLSAEC